MTNESLLAQWRERFDDFSRSGQTVEAWCSANDVSVYRFYYWRRKLARPRPTPLAGDIDWLALPVSGPEALPAGLPVRVGNAVIDVAAGFDPVLLRAVVAALESTQRC